MAMTKKMAPIFLVVFFARAVLATEKTWLCTEEASQRKGNTVLSCGIASGGDENTARLASFDSAKAEFSKICAGSDDCKGHSISVQPRRTACEQTGPKEYKCYRLIEFEIGAASEPGRGSTSASVELADRPDGFQAFRYEQIEKFPKVRLGMPKKDLLESFGAPESVSDSEGQFRQQMIFRGKMCLYENSTCHVLIESGRVKSWENFKPVYTDDLK